MKAQCQGCGGTARLVRVSAKCSDMFTSEPVNGGKSHDGYVPDWIGADGYGDYVNFTVCRHCGQLQGKWPVNGVGQEKFKWGKAS